MRVTESLSTMADTRPPVDVFRSVARSLIAQVLEQGTEHDARVLLTADALMTYACEAASDQAPERLAELL